MRQPSNYPKSRRRIRSRGVSLVELMIALFIFALTAAGIGKAMISAKWNAEKNLYEATSLNVAVSTLEQMKSDGYTALQSPRTDENAVPVFNLAVGNGVSVDIPLGASTVLDVPLATESDGGGDKTLEVTVNPQVVQSSEYQALWLTVNYSWRNPRDGRLFTASVKSLQSIVPAL